MKNTREARSRAITIDRLDTAAALDTRDSHDFMPALAHGPDGAGGAQSGTGHSVSFQSREVIAELEKLKKALAASEHEANAAHRKIAVLADSIVQLRQEMTRREQELDHVRHFAYHDHLTGLPNRSLLLDRLNQAIVQAARQKRQVGLLLLDLDGFKAINDRLGHATGDKLLQRVAERLLSCVRDADTACRYGGDEFVILLPDIDGIKNTAEVAQQIRSCLADHYNVDNHSIAVTASVGVAVYPFDGANQEDLIRRADIAMYLAKAHKNAPSVSLRPGATPAGLAFRQRSRS